MNESHHHDHLHDHGHSHGLVDPSILRSHAGLRAVALSLLVLGYLLNTHGGRGENAWLIVACLLSYMFFNAGGIQVVGWLSGSEMYPLSLRGGLDVGCPSAAAIERTNVIEQATERANIHFFMLRSPLLSSTVVHPGSCHR